MIDARRALLMITLLSPLCPAQPGGDAAVTVRVLRVPGGGIQPRTVVGPDGTLHLLYFSGDPKAGDLYYAARGAGDGDWSAALRVNSAEGSAMALGSTRGGRIALGADGTVHVAWNGSGAGGEGGAGMQYARRAPDATGFEAQRNLMTASGVLDGGGDVAAGGEGVVAVVWHGIPAGSEEPSEEKRRVFLAVSEDGGRTFAPELALTDGGGVCACCGLAGACLPGGETLVLYRSAGEGVHRDVQLLERGSAAGVRAETLDTWETRACPMTTCVILPGADGALLAWEDEGSVRWATWSPEDGIGAAHETGKAGTMQKHPSVAIGEDGEVLVAWVEGARWGGTGRARWRLMDEAGRTIGEGTSGAHEVPAWSFASASRLPEGFVVIY